MSRAALDALRHAAVWFEPTPDGFDIDTETALGDFTRVIPVVERQIAADLRVLERASALIIFAHGSGSSRLSSRNRAGHFSGA
jgi:hypothetical protein